MDQITKPPLPAPPKPNKGHRFKKGDPKIAGRVKGSTNRMPRLLKECIMLAAELEGMNQQGKDKLVGFLRHVARDDLRGFVMLLGRVLPLQIQSQNDMRVEVTYRSVAEVRRELASRGIDMDVMARIMHEPATIVDHENIEMVDDTEPKE